MRKTITLTAIFLLLFSYSPAQDVFQGSITFESTFKGTLTKLMARKYPDGAVYHFRDADVRISVDGGMVESMNEVLVKSKDRESYYLHKDKATAYRVPDDWGYGEGQAVKYSVQKQDEVIQILGYDCQKYLIEIGMSDVDFTVQLWVADIQLADIQGLPENEFIFYVGVKGFPLKKIIEMDFAYKGVPTITMTDIATDISFDLPDKELFEIPDWFYIKDWEGMDAMMD